MQDRIKPARSDSVVAALIAVPIAIGMLLWFYYPTIPRSFLGWVLLLVLGFPTWLLLEWLSERVFGERFFSRLGRAARIALAVPLTILFLVLAAYLAHLGRLAISGG